MWNVHTFRAFLLSARFVFFLYIYFMRPEDVRFIHAFCVYNLHFGTSKAMKDHFVFVTLQQLSQCIWNLFDLTWARSEIYHFLEPIRCDSFCEKESKIDAECVRENERIVGLTLALMFLFNKKKKWRYGICYHKSQALEWQTTLTALYTIQFMLGAELLLSSVLISRQSHNLVQILQHFFFFFLLLSLVKSQ